MSATDLRDAGSEARPSTFLPDTGPRPVEPPMMRSLGGVSKADLANLGGATVSALATTLLIFGRLTPAQGPFGFVVMSWVLFLVIYGLLTSLEEPGPAVVDRLMSAILASAAAVAGFALVTVVVFTLWRGKNALGKFNLFTQDMSGAGPSDPLTVGGIKHAVIGSLIIIAICLILTVPLGLACAVYLNESRSRLSQLVRTIVDAMTALPSILAGLFIFATWILILGFERSGMAAAFATSIMMLPIIIRSADVVLRLVPGNLKEAAAALGAPQWRTVWHVVLPTARSGLATAVILGVARGVGETAPVLLTAGFTSTLNTNPITGPMITLPLATFEFVRSPQPAMIERGFATAAVLMVVVLILFTLARLAGGRPAGTLTKRQSQRRARRSIEDLSRIERPRLEVTSQ